MCLACSTPVRGKTYGAECLAEVLGPDAPDPTETKVPRPDRGIRTLVQVAFGFAVLATSLPWSRFGPGSGAFGAWTRSGRWSLVAALAAIAGLALATARRRPRLRNPAWDVVAASLGALVTIASLLSVLFPPPFSRPWLGPWFGVVSGVLACAASIVAVRVAGEPTSVGI
jgi:hypothetical protein